MPTKSRPRLFERLETARSGSRRRSYALKTDDIFESIQAHLEEIFSVRRGTVEARPDYGLPDFGSAYSRHGDGIRLITRQIKQAIEAFEPRLECVSVTFNGVNDLDLAFQIQGLVQAENGIRELRLHTTFQESHRVRVRGLS